MQANLSGKKTCFTFDKNIYSFHLLWKHCMITWDWNTSWRLRTFATLRFCHN